MAIAYKCDRCGKLYEVNIITHDNEPRFSVERIIKNGSVPRKPIDLCGKCQIALDFFLANKAFAPGEVSNIMCIHGQHDKRFELGQEIRYSPSEVCKILNGTREDEK